MMERMTLREVQEALAAAKARRTKISAPSPTVEELEALARLLERDAAAVSQQTPKRTAKPSPPADSGGHRSSRRSAQRRSPRRR
jgi:hypothetical protein